MVARTKTVGTKVTPAVYETLSLMAAEEKCTVADLIRKLIDDRVSNDGARPVMPDAMRKLESIERQIAFHHEALGELLVKAVAASAGAQYFARLTTSYGQDLTSFVSSQQPMDKQTKLDQMSQFEKNSKEFEKKCLTMKFEN